MLFKKLLYVMFALFLTFEANADDSNLYVGTEIAVAFIQESGFEDDISLFFPNLGYQFGQFYLETGLASIGSFEVKGSTDTSIDVEGLTMTLGKQFKLENSLDFHIHGGAIRWESEAILLGNIVGEDDGTSTVLGFGFSRRPSQSKIRVRAQLQKLFDISGTDILLLSVGINFHL